jgi:hypothetical protein
MNKERIPKKVLYLKVKGKCPRGRPRSRWKQQVRKDVRQREGRPWKKLRRRSCGKTDRWKGLVVRRPT